MRLIDADALENRMYHESFEKDSDLQKWDSGCWIRYKLFEQVLRATPTIEPQPEIIRCKDCKWRINQDESTEWLPCMAVVTPSDFYCGSAKLREE